MSKAATDRTAPCAAAAGPAAAGPITGARKPKTPANASDAEAVMLLSKEAKIDASPAAASPAETPVRAAAPATAAAVFWVSPATESAASANCFFAQSATTSTPILTNCDTTDCASDCRTWRKFLVPSIIPVRPEESDVDIESTSLFMGATICSTDCVITRWLSCAYLASSLDILFKTCWRCLSVNPAICDFSLSSDCSA